MPELQSRRLILWRAYVPRWARDPLSGAGAARLGGRWNTVGQPCLYTALELSTAWAEYNQGFVQHPATVVQLILERARVADLTNGSVLAQFGQDSSIHRTEWRADMAAGRTPATHRVAEMMLREGYDAIVYHPSFMSPGGQCCAVWRWNEPGGPTLIATDPEGRLGLG